MAIRYGTSLIAILWNEKWENNLLDAAAERVKRQVHSWFRFAAQIPASAPDKWPSQEIGPACGITP